LPLESLAEAPVFAVGNAIEDAKTRSAMESIRSFVRAAQSNWDVVPIRDGNLVLSPAEVEAFRSEMAGEKSFRADYANLMMQAVAILSRMTTELNDYLAKQGSAYLWKPHADALTYLITAAGRVFALSTKLLAVAEQRGLTDKAKALNASLDKLKTQTSLVAKALQS
jgi:formate-dependent nitrite reductase cytochrome c552 subunit